VVRKRHQNRCGLCPNGVTVMVPILNGDLPAARTLLTDRYGAGIVVNQVTASAGR